MTRRIHLSVGILALLSLLVAGTAPASADIPPSVPALPVKSGCSKGNSWITPYRAPSFPVAFNPSRASQRGTVDFCATKYIFEDKDSGADYYMLHTKSVWKESDGSPTYSKAGKWSATVSSNLNAISNVYDATPTFTVAGASCTKFNVRFSYMGFGITVPVSTDCGTKITRTVSGKSGAGWSTPSVTALNSVEAIYSQKVPQGKVPTFTVTHLYPYNTYSWKRQKATVRGSTYNGYVVDKHLTKTKTWAVRR